MLVKCTEAEKHGILLLLGDDQHLNNVWCLMISSLKTDFWPALRTAEVLPLASSHFGSDG